MKWQKLKIKQLVSVLLILSFLLPMAKFAKAVVVPQPMPESIYLDTPQAPTEVYSGGAPPADTGGGIWSWLGSSAACLGGLGIGAGSAGVGTAATVAGCAGLAGKITKFLGGDAGGWLSKGLGMGLDAIAKSARKNILSKLYKNMLDLISGEGNQVLNWDLYREEDIANETRGLLLNQIAKATIDPNIDLCNPWDDFGPATNETTAFFRLILGKQAPEKQWSCKASEIKKAGKAFFENFEGGWDAWLEVSTKPMANPYGQYLWAVENQNALIDKLTKEKENQAIAGGGYLGQEKIMQWHIIAEASETDKGGVISLDSCPLGCLPVQSPTDSYCDCPDGVSFKDLENYYGLRQDDYNRLTIGPTMPEICRTIHEQETKACYLVVDRKELFTPGRLFADAASNILLKDVRAAETGDVDVLEYYTAKLIDDLSNALIKGGIRKLGDSLKPDAEQEGDGFSITSRREQIGALEQEGAFGALKSTYEETLLALGDILDKKEELKSLLSTGTVNNDLKIKAKGFYYCAMNKCYDQEYYDCARMYPEDLDQSCIFKDCIDPCFADVSQPTLEECKKKCKKQPPKQCMIPGSPGAECQNESWDFCANPKLPGPEYDNPQVQKTYEFYANITSYGTLEQRTEMINRVDYGGFLDDCKKEELESVEFSGLETCFENKLKGLIDMDQFIVWDKIIIEEFKQLDEQSETNIAVRDNAVGNIKESTPGSTTEFENINQYYKSYYEKEVYSKTARTTDFWQTQLKNDISLKDKHYKNGLDAYKYLVAKRKLLRNVYSTKRTVPNTDVCQDGCDLKELADLLFSKKQARALKMDTFNKSTYKTKWEKAARDLEQAQKDLAQKQEELKDLQEQFKEKPDDKNLQAQIDELEKCTKKDAEEKCTEWSGEIPTKKTEINNYQKKVDDIVAASGNLNNDIKKLNDDITALQKAYDQATEELVVMLTEIDSIINATKIDKQLEEAKNFMGESYVETETGRKNWLTVEKNKIEKYIGSLSCSDPDKTNTPQKPNQQPAATPPPAAPKLPIEENLTAAQIQAKIDALVVLGDAGKTSIPADKQDLCADYAECKTECLGTPDDQIECAMDYWEQRLAELE